MKAQIVCWKQAFSGMHDQRYPGTLRHHKIGANSTTLERFVGNPEVGDARQLLINRHYTCAVKRRWSTAGESPARELGSLHPEAIGAAVEETKPSEPPV